MFLLNSPLRDMATIQMHCPSQDSTALSREVPEPPDPPLEKERQEKTTIIPLHCESLWGALTLVSHHENCMVICRAQLLGICDRKSGVGLPTTSRQILAN